MIRAFRFHRSPWLLLGTLVAATCAISSTMLGQSPASGTAVPDSATVIPGIQYGASGVTRRLAGSGYRDLWTTPIRVEVADLSRLGGGLTPLRVGGGATTRTLHVQGADGVRYVFRTVNKFVGQGLDEELQGTLYEAVLQDQVSAFHPSGAVVVAALLDALGILHARPKLMVLPDDPRLGEFRAAFAGALTLFEERPTEGPDETPGFAGSRRIVVTDRLMERLAENSRHQVHHEEFLTARLFDLIVGDRDRNGNNWLWARFPRGDDRVWRPIPRDRDQAFIRLDGLLKSELRVYEPRLVAFGEKLPQVSGLTRNAWDIDRPFLGGLEATVWDSIVATIQSRLTDSVIEAAVRTLPPEHYEQVGPMMANALKVRRDSLETIAAIFYNIVTQFADVFATDQDNLGMIDRHPDGSVRVRLAPAGGTGMPPAPFFDRTFHGGETREIRVYMLGGADQAVVRGGGPGGIRIRVIGGGGDDVLADSSQADGAKIWFYDAGSRTEFHRGSARIARRSVSRPRSWGEKAGLPPDWGSRWHPFPLVNVRGDVGAVIGGGAVFTTYGFDRYPFARRATVHASYASGVNRGRVDLTQRWILRRHARIRLFAMWSGYEIMRFHGFGNNTSSGPDHTFFRVIHDQVTIRPLVVLTPSTRWRVTGGPIFKYSQTDTTSGSTFLSVERPYGSGGFAQIGWELSGTLDTRDQPVAAARGVFITGEASVVPSAFDVQGTVVAVSGTASVYAAPSNSGNQVLALRVGAKKVWGTVPFHEAAFLGGPNTLRGFRKQRFAGDASLFGNAELRVSVGKFFFLFPTEFGVVGVADAGRVFVDGDTPGPWHGGGGGGLWLAPVNRMHTVSAVVVRGRDFTGLYVRSGFMF